MPAIFCDSSRHKHDVGLNGITIKSSVTSNHVGTNLHDITDIRMLIICAKSFLKVITRWGACSKQTNRQFDFFFRF